MATDAVMGPLSVGEIVLGILGALGTLISMVVGWNASRMADQLDKHQEGLSEHGERIAKLENTAINDTLKTHDNRLVALEKELSSVAGDVKVIRAILEQSK